MNHMKKKSLLLILVIILVVSKLYAKLEYEYKCFKLINVALVNENKQYRVNQNLSIQTADKQLNNMVSVGLYSGNNQMLKIEDTNESMFVLSTQKGNWLYNKKLKSPIRIGASWNINNLDIQDVLRIDFENGYRLNDIVMKEELIDIAHIGEFIELQRVEKNYLYSYVYFSKYNSDSDDLQKYIMIFCDKEKKPIKSAIYTVKSVSNKMCFGYIEIQSYVFNRNVKTTCEINKIEEIKVPKVLFTASKIQELAEYLK